MGKDKKIKSVDAPEAGGAPMSDGGAKPSPASKDSKPSGAAPAATKDTADPSEAKTKRSRHRDGLAPSTAAPNAAEGKVKKPRSANAMKKRREKLKLLKLTCFHCRKPGHAIADCPGMKDKGSAGTGHCWRCGDKGHSAKACKVPHDPEHPYPFAICSVCGEQGHIAGKCTQNDKGFYPNGGGCRFCGSNRHFATKCPEKTAGSKAIKVDGDEDGDGFEVELEDGEKAKIGGSSEKPGEKIKKAKDSKAGALAPADQPKKKKKVVKF